MPRRRRGPATAAHPIPCPATDLSRRHCPSLTCFHIDDIALVIVPLLTLLIVSAIGRYVGGYEGGQVF